LRNSAFLTGMGMSFQYFWKDSATISMFILLLRPLLDQANERPMLAGITMLTSLALTRCHRGVVRHTASGELSPTSTVEETFARTDDCCDPALRETVPAGSDDCDLLCDERLASDNCWTHVCYCHNLFSSLLNLLVL
jgi:hypothetical protein